MTTTSYVPRQGSVADKALELLRAAGTPMSANDICAEIDSEPKSFWVNIGVALREGVIASAKDADGHVLFSVGDGVPPAPSPTPSPAAAAKAEAPPPTPRPAPARKYAALPKIEAAPPPPKRVARKGAKAKPARIPKPAVKLKRAYKRRPKPPQSTPPGRAIASRTQVAVVSAAPAQAPAPSSGLQCALFNTGALFIETEKGESVNLTKEQTRELVAYLDRLAASMETTA